MGIREEQTKTTPIGLVDQTAFQENSNKTNQYITIMNANTATVKTTQTATGTLVPNTEVARKYLETLGQGEENFTFQYFKEGKDIKKNGGIIEHYTTIDEALEGGCTANKRGYGVFVCVNETDGEGRKKENITTVRAMFIDVDKGVPNLEGLAKPSMIVQSSETGKNHYYWRLKHDESKSEWETNMPHLIKQTGADVVVKDLPRVLRVPGFWHLKGEPVMSLLLECNDLTYRIDEIGIKVDPTVSVEPDGTTCSPTKIGNQIQLTRGEVNGYLEYSKSVMEIQKPGNRAKTLFTLAKFISAFVSLGGTVKDIEGVLVKAARDTDLELSEITKVIEEAKTEGTTNIGDLELEFIYYHANITATAKSKILSLHHYKNRIRLNDITGSFEYQGGERDMDWLIVEINRIYRNIKIDESLVKKVIKQEALKNIYSPLKDYFANLPEQDPALLGNKFSSKNLLGVETDIVQEFFIKWLVSIYRRGQVLSNDSQGVSIEGVLLLIGDQGCGKSSFFRSVAPLGLFTDFAFQSARDDAAKLKSATIVHLNEVETAFSKKAASELKAFTTEDYDSNRRLYTDGETVKSQRHCVFAASTNTTEILRDDTGNRRWWTVQIPGGFSIPFKMVEKHRDELWGAVKALAEQRDETGEYAVSHWLDKVEQQTLEVHNARFLEQDPRFETINLWLSLKRPNTFITIEDVWTDALKNPVGNMTRTDVKGIDRALLSLGCEKKLKHRMGTRQVNAYLVPLTSQQTQPSNTSEIPIK